MGYTLLPHIAHNLRFYNYLDSEVVDYAIETEALGFLAQPNCVFDDWMDSGDQWANNTFYPNVLRGYVCPVQP